MSNYQLTIISVIHKLPAWVIESCNYYLKLLNVSKYRCQLIDVKADSHRANDNEENMFKEAQKLIKQIPARSKIIVLDEHGTSFTSVAFANKLEQLCLDSPLTFIIGGADGIHSSLKKMAHMSVQLSNFTLPHALARVVLLEQLYRATTILNNHPYHRE